MAKKTKAATGRTKIKALPKSQRELASKDMRKIRGGETPTEQEKHISTIKFPPVKI